MILTISYVQVRFKCHAFDKKYLIKNNVEKIHKSEAQQIRRTNEQ